MRNRQHINGYRESISPEESTRILYGIEKTPGEIEGSRKYQNLRITNLKITDSKLLDVSFFLIQNYIAP